MSFETELRELAQVERFNGVISIVRQGEELFSLARGYAHRAHKRPNATDTMFATASATKGLTALGVVSLVESGQLDFDTTLVSLLGDSLPLVDSAVTIEHLLGHTSGVGDYLDEEAIDDIDDYLLTVYAHALNVPDDYLPMLRGHEQKTAPGATFAYNNGGYVLLALAIEAASGQGYHEVLQERVLDPAGMTDTAFLRSDNLPSRAALGYLKSGHTNVFHLPVVGVGDGGVYSTVADVQRLWRALFDGAIVSLGMAEHMTRRRNDPPNEDFGYGLGFWLHRDNGAVVLEGMDAGVSFRSLYHRPSGVGYTVMSNTSTDVWPVVRYLSGQLAMLMA